MTEVQCGLVLLKDRATMLLLWVREMENRATVTVDMSYNKSMLVDGLLRNCDEALCDPRLADEAEMIRDELRSAGVRMPSGVLDPKALLARAEAQLQKVLLRLGRQREDTLKRSTRS